MHIRTSHRIVPHGDDKMVLSDCSTGAAIVTAQRGADVWTLKGEGAEDRSVPVGEKREPSVDAMIAMAFDIVPHEGISTFVPYRHLADGTKLHLRDEQ